MWLAISAAMLLCSLRNEDSYDQYIVLRRECPNDSNCEWSKRYAATAETVSTRTATTRTPEPRSAPQAAEIGDNCKPGGGGVECVGGYRHLALPTRRRFVSEYPGKD